MKEACGFSVYFRTLFFATDGSQNLRATGEVLCWLRCLLFFLFLSFGLPTYTGFGFLLMVCMYVFSYGIVCVRRRPTLYRLLPLSPKKKAVWFLCACPLLSLAAFGVLVLIGLLVGGVVVLIALIGGEGGSFEAEESVAFVWHVQGILFCIAIALFVLGGSVLCDLIKNKKVRIFLSALLPVALFLSVKGLELGYGLETGALIREFDALPLAPLWLSLYAVAGVSLLTLALWKLVRFLCPKEEKI